MLLGHGAGGNRRGLGRLLAPDVDPALARLVLGRSAYTTAEEQEAEPVASLILGQAGQRHPASAARQGTGATAVLCRMEHAW
jgi:hypothetical protein